MSWSCERQPNQFYGLNEVFWLGERSFKVFSWDLHDLKTKKLQKLIFIALRPWIDESQKYKGVRLHENFGALVKHFPVPTIDYGIHEALADGENEQEIVNPVVYFLENAWIDPEQDRHGVVRQPADEENKHLGFKKIKVSLNWNQG